MKKTVRNARIGRSNNLLIIIVLIPLWTSVLVRAFAWTVLFGRNGVINSTLISLGVIDSAFDLLFNFFSVLVSMVHALMPIAVLLLYSTMQNIDRNLELAASTLGSEPSNAFWRIYFPMSMPGVVSAALVTFILSMGFFVQPALLGSPRETMIAQVIIQQIDDLFNWELAAAIAVVVLIMTIFFIMIYDRIFGISTVTSAKGSVGASGPVMRATTAVLGNASSATGRVAGSLFPRQRSNKLGSGRRSLTLVATLVLIFMSVPLVFLIPVSFTSSPFVEWPPRGFSIQWYETYFQSPLWREATLRSFSVGFATATLAVMLGVPAAFGLNRLKFRGKGLVLPCILLPLIVPNIIVALALFYFFSQLGLVGTEIGLIIGHTVLALPYVVLTLVAVLQNYDERLDQAAWTLGAKPIVTFRMITFPIIKVGFVTSFLFAFMISFDEIAVALFLSSGLQSTLPKRLWSEAHISVSPTLAAVSTILIVMVILVVVTSELINRRKANR